MKITYDARARAAYIYLSDNLVLVTREITDAVNVDLDADANVVGVELLDVDEPTVENITTSCICELAEAAAPGAGEQEP